MDQTTTDADKSAGAILNEAQLKRVKVAIAIMTALFVIGLVALIGRVIYLVNRPSAPQVGAALSPSHASPELADIKLALPAGARLTGATFQQQRVLAQYTGPLGDGLMMVDLVTGRVVSHIRIETKP